MTATNPSVRRPLLAIAVQDRRAVRAVLAAVVLWAVLGWALTSILAGRGVPFDYAIHNFSLGELRMVLWSGTAVLAAGIAGVGWGFVQLGRSLWRNENAVSFGLHFSPNGAGAVYDKIVRWYGGLLVIAGSMIIPLGVSLLFILGTCRYMRDV